MPSLKLFLRTFSVRVCVHRFIFLIGLIAGLLLTRRSAYADTSLVSKPAPSPFGHLSENDWAIAWMEHLFRGASLPPTFAQGELRLTSMTQALHGALSFYSIGMLVLAGILMIYHLIVMVVETAHHGVALGKRTSQMWAPIRFVVALGLLVPISGGLNCGQYIVIKIAEAGSALASNAWSAAVSEMGGGFSDLALPHSPSMNGLAASALEMELCRDLYHNLFTSSQSDALVKLAGDIGLPNKIPRQRLADESWRYTNMINASVPLCGEFRFPAYHKHIIIGDLGMDETDRVADDFADYARTETDKIIIQTRAIADRIWPTFARQGSAIDSNIRDELSSLISAHQADLDAKLLAEMTNASAPVDRTLSDSTQSGWITAGAFVLDLARRQELFGELASQAIPTAQVPLFAHAVLARQALTQSILDEPALIGITAAQTSKLTSLYDQTASSVKQMRSWLYDDELADTDLVVSDSFEVRDHLGMTTDPQATFTFFARLLDEAALVYGVWGEKAGAETAVNPIAALTEFGRRQLMLGTYLFNAAGAGLAEPNAAAGAALFVFLGGSFIICGIVLIFLMPLLPFFRFFVSIVTWLLSVFEAVVAVPLMALAHLNFTGDGLSGGTARQAYQLWLGVMIRPVLTLFGLIIGLLLFSFAVAFLNAIFFNLTRGNATNSDLLLTANIGLLFLYVVLVYAAANAAFKGITLLPDQALRWLGNFVVTETTADAPPAAATTGSSVSLFAAASQLLSAYSSSSSQASSNISEGRQNSGVNPGAAEARAYSFKTALFPLVADPDSRAAKPNTDAPKSTSSTDKLLPPVRETAPTKASTDPALPRIRRKIEKIDPAHTHIDALYKKTPQDEARDDNLDKDKKPEADKPPDKPS